MAAKTGDNPPWRHHYIPEFYLKRWAAANGQLVQFSKPWGDTVKPKRVYPRQTGFVDRLYELQGLPPETAQVVETEFFRPVDTMAAAMLEAMEAGVSTYTGRERSAWARFLVSLLFRNPDNLRAAKIRLAADVRTVDSQTERMYRQARRPQDPPTYAEYLALNESESAISRAALQMIAATTSSKEIADYLVRMHWGSLLLPLEVPALMTSDRPVLMLNGLRDRKCEILMPVGTKRIFYAVNDPLLADEISWANPRRLVGELNKILIRRAYTYVYAMSDVHLSYVQDNMGLAKEPTFAERSATYRDQRLQRNHARR